MGAQNRGDETVLEARLTVLVVEAFVSALGSWSLLSLLPLLSWLAIGKTTSKAFASNSAILTFLAKLTGLTLVACSVERRGLSSLVLCLRIAIGVVVRVAEVLVHIESSLLVSVHRPQSTPRPGVGVG